MPLQGINPITGEPEMTAAQRTKRLMRQNKLKRIAERLKYTGPIPSRLSPKQFKQYIRGGTIGAEIEAGKIRTKAKLQTLALTAPTTAERRAIRQQQIGGITMPVSGGAYGVQTWSPNTAQQVNQIGLAGGTIATTAANLPAIAGTAGTALGLGMGAYGLYQGYQALREGDKVLDLPWEGGGQFNIPGLVTREPTFVPDLPSGGDIVDIKRYGGRAQIVAVDSRGNRYRLRANNTWKRIPKSPYFRVGKAPSKKNVSRLIRALKHHVGISKKYAKLAKMKGVPTK